MERKVREWRGTGENGEEGERMEERVREWKGRW